MEFLIGDRLSWLRFLGFDLGAVTPDENTIRLFREKLTRAARSTRCSPPLTGTYASAAILVASTSCDLAKALQRKFARARKQLLTFARWPGRADQ